MTKKAKPVFWGMLFLAAFGWHSACSRPHEHSFQGRTMGTTYHIKVVATGLRSVAALQAEVDALLEFINASMSTYRPDSEISRFNAHKVSGQPFAISADFLQVMQTAGEIYRLSEGAWDATVLPLVELWGFGRSAAARQTLPSPSEINQALKQVGFDQIQVDGKGFLVKKRPEVTLDLASIAKGYAVDRVALLLKKKTFTHYLVEIGGEVYAAGLRLDGKPWQVGINQPDPSASATAVYKAVALEDRAMATSGDYRNFFEINGRRYSHIIDPRSGYPVGNGVISASVFASNCTLADGLATAMMVLGPEKGIALLDRLPNVEGIIIVRQSDGGLKNYVSHGVASLE
jgi:thiamine biosynthesis lipoprotein